MSIGKQFRSIVVLGGLLGATMLLPDCSAKGLANAAKGCDGIDATKSESQAAVKAFADASAKLQVAATAVEAKWLAVCNEINTELKLDNTQTSADKACAVLNTRVAAALAKGVQVTLDVAYDCKADVSVQASCEAQCNVAANCDVKAKCEPGKLVVRVPQG